MSFRRLAGFGLGVAWLSGWLGCKGPSDSGLFAPGTSGSGGAAAGQGGSAGIGGSSGSSGAGGTSAGSGGSDGGSGGSVNGGSGGGEPQMGGSGGGEPDASSGDANPPQSDAAPTTCGGDVLFDVCWYLGEIDASCSDTCADHGGYNPAATAIIGTPAQGGNLENCEALLNLLLDLPPDSVVEGTQLAEFGVGCHTFDASGGFRWWLTEPDFDPDTSLIGAEVVCGCNE